MQNNYGSATVYITYIQLVIFYLQMRRSLTLNLQIKKIMLKQIDNDELF